MAANLKRTLFDHCRRSLVAAGLATTGDDSLVCPLCWQEAVYSEFSVEHFVPKKVGGRAVTLTCTKCNNDQGSDLDAHLVNFQAVKDAFKGHGTLATELNINGKRMVANLEWKEGKKNFIVVGKASDPKDIAAIKDDFAAGRVSDMTCTLFYEYATNNFNTAVLRSAYLGLFERFGYAYAQHDVVQAIRRRISDRSITQPSLSSLIIELEGAEMPYDSSHYIVRRKIEGTECLLVIIRVRKATTTYLGAFMPNTSQPIDQFETLMEQCKKQSNGKTMTISKQDFLA